MKNFTLRLAVRFLMALREFLLWLASLVLPPHVSVLEDTTGVAVTMLLHSVAKFRVADLLGEKTLSASELAKTLGTDPKATHRFMRALSTVGYFHLSRDGGFSNNRLSRVLMEKYPQSLRGFAEYFGTEALVRSWAGLDETIRTGKSSFNRVHEMSVWDWFTQNPADGEIFAEAMSNVTLLDADFIADSSVFAKAKIICDVAGGRGTLLGKVLKRWPLAKGVLLEGPQVLERANKHLENKGLSARVEFIEGNIFETLPANLRSVDIFILKDILHDWDDSRSKIILSKIREVMKPEAQLVIAESVVELSEILKPGPIIDVQMMVTCDDGQQRSREEFQKLLEESGFKMVKVESLVTPVHLVIAETRAFGV